MQRRTRADNREQWQRRVQRWRHSGLSATAFAAQMGLNVHSLRRWKYVLDQEQATGPQAPASSLGVHLPLIELRPGPAAREERFELEWGPGRLLRVPATFETNALRRLLAVLREGL